VQPLAQAPIRLQRAPFSALFLVLLPVQSLPAIINPNMSHIGIGTMATRCATTAMTVTATMTTNIITRLADMRTIDMAIMLPIVIATIVALINGGITGQRSIMDIAIMPGGTGIIDAGITTDSEHSGVLERIAHHPTDVQLDAVMTRQVLQGYHHSD